MNTDLKLLQCAVFINFGLLLISCFSKDSLEVTKKETHMKVIKSEEEWKKQLSPEEYYILREKGTEAPYSGKFNMHFEKGVYTCKACGAVLFDSHSKFNSHCGWPSFDQEIAKGKITEKLDTSHGMTRMEILCANCGSHLGHVFNDGPTKTGLRYCVNSASLDFVEE